MFWVCRRMSAIENYCEQLSLMQRLRHEVVLLHSKVISLLSLTHILSHTHSPSHTHHNFLIYGISARIPWSRYQEVDSAVTAGAEGQVHNGTGVFQLPQTHTSTRENAAYARYIDYMHYYRGCCVRLQWTRHKSGWTQYNILTDNDHTLYIRISLYSLWVKGQFADSLTSSVDASYAMSLCKMKFNDKELGAWATVFSADKEGLLEKKGAGRGQGE